MKSPYHRDWAGNTSWEHPFTLEGRCFGSGSVKMVLTRRMWTQVLGAISEEVTYQKCSEYKHNARH